MHSIVGDYEHVLGVGNIVDIWVYTDGCCGVYKVVVCRVVSLWCVWGMR